MRSSITLPAARGETLATFGRRCAEFRHGLLVFVTALLVTAGGAAAQPPRAPLPLEPAGAMGEAIFPAFEGWYRNDDGTSTILLGYYNRNDHPVDVAVGDGNRIEPGGPDHGQPNHFLPGRAWGVFTIKVPEDFGDQTFTWTLSVNNQQSEVSFWLNPSYYVDPFLNRANGNMPPRLRIGGDEVHGPPVTGISATLEATVGEPLELAASVQDVPLTNPPPPRANRRPRPELILTWRLYRGPADVTFDTGAEEDPENGRHEFSNVAGGDTTTWVTFAEPGEYRLMATANDISGNGGGGDQCCWTTGYVDVTVR